MNKKQLPLRIHLIAFLLLCTYLEIVAQKSIAVWLTNSDKSALFQQQPQSLQFTDGSLLPPVITIDEKQTYQTIDGFGYALTGGSAMHS